MATLQARFLVLVFAALAVAISYNAIFLQKGMHPAPMTADPKQPPGKSGRLVRKSHKITQVVPATETTASLQTSKTVMSIQSKLSENGYEPGPADGLHGQMTRAAIMAYQHDNGLPVTGEATEGLLRHMILGVSLADVDGRIKSSTPEETKKLIKSVQLTLTKLGFDAGPADGLWGATTRAAIEQFERHSKVEARGRISGRLIKLLQKANGGALVETASG